MPPHGPPALRQARVRHRRQPRHRQGRRPGARPGGLRRRHRRPRPRVGCEAAADELAAATGRRIVPVRIDTGDDDAVRARWPRRPRALGGIDILVNNAAQPGGQAPPPKLAELTRAAVLRDVDVKVMGYLRCAQAVAPHMIEHGWGRIVNISRPGGTLDGVDHRLGAQRVGGGATKNLADELGPHGINVTVVHPGLTRTEATAGVVRHAPTPTGSTPPTWRPAWRRATASKRLIDASEVADVVAFLASPRSVSINGDAIACGGGQPGVIHYDPPLFGRLSKVPVAGGSMFPRERGQAVGARGREQRSHLGLAAGSGVRSAATPSRSGRSTDAPAASTRRTPPGGRDRRRPGSRPPAGTSSPGRSTWSTSMPLSARGSARCRRGRARTPG